MITHGRIFLAILALSASLHGADTNDPSAEIVSFKLAPGFTANLFASEADGVVKPIQSRFDERGRLWVIGSTVYPQLKPGQTPDDKVVILEDTDGDGKSDRTTVFAGGLFIPTGIEITRNGCYVGNSTELLELIDHDGDGKADERRVVLRGFGTGDNHQNLNSFQWGPGGELWFSQGLHSHSQVETPWGVERLNNAGIWRLRTGRLRLDPFFGNELPPHNPWGFVFDRWDQLLVLAGNGHGIFDPLPISIRGHRILPLEQIWSESKGRKLCGGDIVQNAHFPEDWQGVMVVGGFMNHAVYALDISEYGSSLRIKDRQPLLTSTHQSFRPVDVKVGPDGAVYVTDWYNPIIGHYQASFRHPDRDKQHGRIWRITATGRPLVRFHKALDKASVPQLLQLLESPDRFAHDQARRLLFQKPPGEVIAALDERLNSSQDEALLVDVLGLFEAHETVRPVLVERLLGARDPRHRARAASLLGYWNDRMPNGIELLKRAVQDPHPRVRLAAVVALGWTPSVEAFLAALDAVREPRDSFLDYALTQCVHVHKTRWLPLLHKGGLGIEDDLDKLQFLVRADATPDVVKSIRKIAYDLDPGSDQRMRLAQLLGRFGESEDLRRLLDPAMFVSHGDYQPGRHAKALATILVNIRERGVKPPPGHAAQLSSLLQQTNAARSVAIRLAGAWRVLDLMPSIQALATNRAVQADVRAASIETLGAWATPAAVDLLQTVARDASELPTIRGEAVGALAFSRIENAARLAASLLAEDRDGASAPALLVAFSGRKSGLELLASSLETQPARRDAARVALRWLNQNGQAHPKLARVLAAQSGFTGDPLRATPEFVRELAAEVRSTGDATRGAAIFRRPDLACMNCHRIGNDGGALGPDLNTLGTGQPLDFIIGAVLEPNREIKENYEAVELLLKEGESLTGYRVRSDDGFVTLRDSTRGEVIRLPRNAVQQIIPRGSLMPQGLVDSLTRAELRDLFQFLSSLGRN